MYDNPQHINYSAADIRRYLNGGMTRDEMYTLEKQAAEDPMLADAIDGYLGISSEAAEADLATLRTQLAGERKEAKVVPMHPPRGFKWWKQGIAAAIAALVIFAAATFLKTNKKEQVAANTPSEKTQNEAPHDSINASDINTTPTTTVGGKTNTVTKKPVFIHPDSLKQVVIGFDGNLATATSTIPDYTPVDADKDGKKWAEMKPKPSADTSFRENKPAVVTATDDFKKDEMAKSSAPASPVVTERAPGGEVQIPAKKQNAESVSNSGIDRARNATGYNGVINTQEGRNNQSDYYTYDKKDNEAANNNRSAHLSLKYQFNYRVTDNNGNSIPYTNITVPNQLTTYSRSDGSFGLNSVDSTLRVNIKANGYEPKSFLLRNNNQYANVSLNEDKLQKEKDMVVVGDQKNFALRKKSNKTTTTVGDAEPLDGWVTYDSYLANNIDLSEKSKGVVELSVEVTKKGEITGVTVEKSLGAKEDEEAIRLIKEGPRWKTKKKRGKAKIVVTF
jgi:hypothetical protein